ncbi:MAG: sigma-54 dependent transcriptional regulator [Planctomycetota bacterium]
MTAKARTLVVDDDRTAGSSLAAYLAEVGHDAHALPDAPSALQALGEAEKSGRPVDVVISDMSMPGMTGMQLLEQIVERHPGTSVIIITGYGTIEAAVEAVRLGAVDYLTKPVMDDELEVAVERALKNRRLAKENVALRAQVEDRYGLENLVGADPRMTRVYELVEAVAGSKTTVLMSGESGTGKSLVARAIHTRSGRSAEPFVEISCGSIPETLLESELFGHVKGAFTGAHADKVGRFLAANGGTIFLDEINSASAGMQLKLLRVLQERKLEPVGSTESIEVDVRVILASNQALEELVAAGTFRQDLYYRINVVKIELPPLRERTSDVPLLAEHFLQLHSSEIGRQIDGFDDRAVAALASYAWPGNVRELSNVVERAVVLCKGEKIGVSDLPADVAQGGEGPLVRAAESIEDTPASGGDPSSWEPKPLAEALLEPERRILLRALEANDWNRQQTADALEINRTTLYKKMKALGIDEPPRRAG